MSSLTLDRKLRKAGVPIDGVVQNGSIESTDFTIVFAANATAEQIAAGNAILAAFDPALEQRRYEIDGLLAAWWNGKVATGITPTGQSFQLGSTAADVALLTGQFVLAKTAVDLGVKTTSDTFTIVASDGSAHSFTLADLTSLLLDYGQQRSALSQQFVTYQAAVDEATSIADLDALTFA